MDLNATPPAESVPLWSETRWVGSWSPDEGVGIYVHAGRFRRDLEMWWVQVAAYLPERALCVERSWGRNESGAGVRVGGLDVAMSEDGWTCSFDGVGQLTTISELASGPRGASAPSRSLRFDLSATAVAPVWDMYADAGEARESHASDMHIQQGYETTGLLSVDGREWDLAGVGFKDHSSGAREFDSWRGHRFLLIVTSEWTAHMLVLEDERREALEPWGVFFRDGSRQEIRRFSMPAMEDPEGGPVRGEVAFETSEGEAFDFDFELIHGLPISITDANDNINGVDWDLEGDPALFVEGNARLTAADGSVAYAYVERGAHQSAIPRPQAWVQ